MDRTTERPFTSAAAEERGRVSPRAHLRHTDGMSEPDVVNALLQLGFNLNEGRAYAALLRLGPSTGYEVSQRAGVPRSAVYTALRRLVSGGAARALAGSPERFMATPPEALVALLQKRFVASSDTFKSAVEQLDVRPSVPDAFSVKGYDRVLEEAGRLVHEARATLVASGWPRELWLLQEELAAAEARGVCIVLFSHADLGDAMPGVHFSYRLPEAQLEAFWKHRLVLVIDERRTLIGATEGAPTDGAVLSEAPAIAELSTSQIALDITLLAQRHGHDVSDVMAQILGDRVGRLDELLASGTRPSLGERRTPAPGRARARTKRAPRRAGAS